MQSDLLSKNNLLSDAQLERLCALVYLNDILVNQDKSTLKEITDTILMNGLNGALPCLMAEAEWLTILHSIRDDAALNGLKLIKTIDITERLPDGTLPGHRAFAFSDDLGNVYAIFRGTGSDEEWYDNAIGMVDADTPQQKAAQQFVMELAKENKMGKIIVAGHSKGGNKAQYAAITTPEDTISYCLSIDGQGFSPAFVLNYLPEIKKRRNRIHLIAERRDYVHCLGLYLYEPTQHFNGRRDGQPIFYFHCPDALRDSGGHISSYSAIAPVADVLHSLTAYFLQTKKYESIRYETATDLVTLMMVHKKASTEEIAEALVNILLVFMDLLSHSALFMQQIINVCTKEAELLCDTFDYIGQTRHGGVLRFLVVEKLSHRFVTNPTVRADFLAAIKFMRRLIRKMLPQSRLREHIISFSLLLSRKVFIHK